MDPEEGTEGEEEETPELDTEGEEAEGTESEGEETEGAEGEEGEGGEAAAGAGEEGGKVSRRTARVQSLEKERDAEKAQAAEYKRRYDELIAQQHTQRTPAQVEAEAAAEQAKMAAMDPLDRVTYIADKKINALQSQIQGLGFQTQDSSDKATFEARASIDPLYEKYKDRVETALAGMRAKGANTTREALLTYMIGEDARKKAAQKPEGQRRKDAASSRVAKANGKAPTTRGDTTNSKSEKSLEDRLRGVQI